MLVFIGLMLYCIFVVAQSSESEVFELIGDVLEHRAKIVPTGVVTALLCRNGKRSPEAALSLEKYLSRRNIMITSQVSSQKFMISVQNGEKWDQPCTRVLDLSCRDSTLVLQEANAKKMFAARNRWLLLLENETLPKLDDLDIFLDTEVTIAIKTSRTIFILEEVYKIKENLFRQRIGIWEMGKGLNSTASLSIASRRMNLQKSIINGVMVIIEKESLNHLNDTIGISRDIFAKVNYALFYNVMDIVNASTNMVIIDSYGAPKNGTWDGQTGYLQRGDADIGMNGMLIRKDRLPYVWFIACTTRTSGAFIFRQPPLSSVDNIFALPFSRTVWLTSAGLVIAIGVLLYIALWWEMKEHLNDDTCSWSDVAMISVGAICQQGYKRVAKNIPGRILTIMLFSVTLFIYTSYSACIVSLLQLSSNSIRTLSDLYHSDFELSVANLTYNKAYFSQANEPLQRIIYNHKIAPPGGPERFINTTEGVRKIRDGRFAFHVDIGIAYKMISEVFKEEEKCGIQGIEFLTNFKDPMIAVSKKSPYKEIFTIAYRRINDIGLRHREHVKFYGNKPRCTGAGAAFVKVGLVDCRFAFLMLVYGFLCAIVIFMIEILYYKWRQKISSRPVEFTRMKNRIQYPSANICVTTIQRKRQPSKRFLYW